MADTRRYRKARTEFRHQAQIDERQFELRALAGVDEIAMRQHRGAASDRGTLHGRDDRLPEPDEGIHQAGLRGFARLLGFEEILDVVTGAERIAGGMPQHDTDRLVLVSLAKNIGKARVHAGGQGILPFRTVQFDPQDAVGTLGDDVAHDVFPYWSSAQPLGRHVFPCLRNGAAFAQALDALGIEAKLAEDFLGMLADAGRTPGGNFRDAMHLDRTADRRGQLATAPSSGTTISFAASCGSSITS